MPPIQPSLRGSLLTGASALALSVSGSGAYAQYAPHYDTTLPSWTVWVEGASFQTAGGSFNIPSLPGLGAPFLSLNPRPGLEGAFGFDYRWQDDPVWHFVFDLRYGRTRTATANSSGSSVSTSTVRHIPSSLFGHVTSFGVVPTSIVTTRTSNSSSTQASEWENHIVADFMIGRDIGMGTNRPELEFGIRVADLHASAQAQSSTSSTTTSNAKATFYCGTNGHGGVRLCTSQLALPGSSSSSTTVATWNSRFFGVGPRLAVTQGVPLVGFWAFDYEAGVAALFGPRSLNLTVTSGTAPALGVNTNALVGIFNANASAAISYFLTPHVKVSGGIRADFYDGALTTYNINTGALENLSRTYWGPFVRLTGAF